MSEGLLSLREEYTDEKTGTRLTIEYDIPEWPRITVFPPPVGMCKESEIYDAIGRLLAKAGIHPEKRET